MTDFQTTMKKFAPHKQVDLSKAMKDAEKKRQEREKNEYLQRKLQYEKILKAPAATLKEIQKENIKKIETLRQEAIQRRKRCRNCIFYANVCQMLFRIQEKKNYRQRRRAR